MSRYGVSKSYKYLKHGCHMYITYVNCRKYKVEYFRDIFLHRMDGPALVVYDTDGSMVYEEFWIDGKQLDPLEFYCRAGELDV